MNEKTAVAREIDTGLSSLFPKNVVTEVAAPWMWRAELVPEEEIIIRNAVDKRRREFTAGRTCARSILRQLGFDADVTIGKDKHGAPIWPEGIVGSISHADQVCVVSLCRRMPGLESLGVDVEKDTGLNRDVVDLVCDAHEKEACRSARTADSYDLAKVVFSAKESVYKCLYPVMGIVMDFKDVHIQLDVPAGKFVGTVNASLDGEAAGGTCRGMFVHDAGHIYTGC
ncbi:MAG: 4'-phosphopantetheinyl transferase superfamily protein, partial [Gammaproteobacteria bacterium]|nr:4'-phosphopantetheinyl transferase superfamily protein [Gammaproteobacteria bacterium]